MGKINVDLLIASLIEYYPENIIPSMFKDVLARQGLEYKNGKIEYINKLSNCTPKFKKGDYIVSKINGFIYRVEKVNYFYDLDCIRGALIDKVDSECRLWTVEQDATNGQVLAIDNQVFIFKNISSNGEVYCHGFITCEGNFCCTEHAYTKRANKVRPATKAELIHMNDVLTKSGYEWDNKEKVIRTLNK